MFSNNRLHEIITHHVVAVYKFNFRWKFSFKNGFILMIRSRIPYTDTHVLHSLLAVCSGIYRKNYSRNKFYSVFFVIYESFCRRFAHSLVTHAPDQMFYMLAFLFFFFEFTLWRKLQRILHHTTDLKLDALATAFDDYIIMFLLHHYIDRNLLSVLFLYIGGIRP